MGGVKWHKTDSMTWLNFKAFKGLFAKLEQFITSVLNIQFRVRQTANKGIRTGFMNFVLIFYKLFLKLVAKCSDFGYNIFHKEK